MNIYFHADDAGIDYEVTKRVINCWEENLIEGFSVIANESCYQIMKDSFNENIHKEISLSVHLNLSDGKSLGSFSETYLLTDHNCNFSLGLLKLMFYLIVGSSKRKVFLQQVYNEWEKQILSVKKMAGDRRIFAIDGHNHIHMFPSLFSIAVELAQKHSINKVRISKEFYFAERWIDYFKLYYLSNSIKRTLLWFLTRIIMNRKIIFSPKTEAIIGIQYSGHMLPEKVRAGINKTKKKNMKSVEIIFHPGRASYRGINNFASTKSARKFFLSYWRAKEYESLKIIRNEFSRAGKSN